MPTPLYTSIRHAAGHTAEIPGTNRYVENWWLPTSPTTPTIDVSNGNVTTRVIPLAPTIAGGWSVVHARCQWRWYSGWPNASFAQDCWWFNFHNYPGDNGNTGAGGVGWGFGQGVSSVLIGLNPYATNTAPQNYQMAAHVERNTLGTTNADGEWPLTMPAADTWQSLWIEVTPGLRSNDYLTSNAQFPVGGGYSVGSDFGGHVSGSQLLALTGGLTPQGRLRIFQDGVLTFDSITLWPGGIRTLNVAKNPQNGNFYMQGYYVMYTGSIYTGNWQTTGEGIIELTAPSYGSTPAMCLADTNIDVSHAVNLFSVYDAVQGAPSPNGHGGNSWASTPVTGVRTDEQFIVPPEFQTGGPPVNTVLPTISGTLSSGSTLTATPGTYSPAATSASYQWQRSYKGGTADANWVAVGSDQTTYALTSADIGQVIRVVVTPSNASGAGATAASVQTAIVDDGAGGLIANGTFETDVSGWGNQNATSITRDTVTKRTGLASLQCVVPGSVSFEGTYWGSARGVYYPAGTQYQVVTWVMVTTGKTLRVALNIFDANDQPVPATGNVPVIVTGNTGVWQSVTLTAIAATGSAYGQLSFTTGAGTPQAETFNIDDVAWRVPTPTAATFDAAASSSVAGATSLTWAHTCTGTNLVLYVSVQADNTGADEISGVTYNAVALTRIAHQVTPSGGTCDLWRLIAPATGAHNVVVSTVHSDSIVGGSVSVAGADQTAPERSGSTQTATGTSLAPAVTISSNANDVVVAACGVGGDSATTIAANVGTSRWAVHQAAGNTGAGSTIAGAASVSPSWTLTGSAKPWGAVGTSVIAAATPAAPVNSVAPAVSGTATNGQILTTTNGTWTNTPTAFGYQWQRAGVSIAGATSSTYTLANGDVGSAIRCVVTATNAGGSTSANSNATAAVADAVPVSVAPPVIVTPGGATYFPGVTLFSDTGAWSFTPSATTTYSYQWQRADNAGFTVNVTSIGANQATDMLTSGELAKYVRVRVTATNGAGSATANSNVVGPVVAAGVSSRMLLGVGV